MSTKRPLCFPKPISSEEIELLSTSIDIPTDDETNVTTTQTEPIVTATQTEPNVTTTQSQLVTVVPGIAPIFKRKRL